MGGRVYPAPLCRAGSRPVGVPRTSAEWVALCAAAMGALALGWHVASHPDLLRLGIPITPWTVAGSVVGAAVVGGVLVWPRLALALLVGVAYLNVSDVLVRSFGLPSLLQLLSLPVLISACAHHGPGLFRRMLGDPLLGLLSAYALLLLASTTWADQPTLAEARFAHNAKALLLYLLILLLVTGRARARVALWAMVATGGFLGALGVLGVTTSLGGILSEMARVKSAQIYGDVFGLRLAGPLGDPNFFAQILVPLVPVAVFLVWSGGGRRPRLLAGLALAAMLAAIVLTYSRGGALALLVVGPASLVAHGVRWRTLGFAGLGLALAAATAAPAGVRERLATIGQFLPDQSVLPETDSSFQERLVLMGAAWEMLAANPLLGVGAGNYTVRFAEYAERFGSVAQAYQDPGDTRYPHNLYLEAGAETGLVGLGLLLAALLVALMGLESARGAFRSQRDTRGAILARALQISLTGYLLSSLFLHADFERYLWLLLGMAGALRAVSRRDLMGPGRGHGP